MASDSKRTENIRRHKRNSQGRKRKNKIIQKGTTPTKAKLFGEEE